MQRQQYPHRLKSHTAASNTKRIALGDTVGRVPPAWRSSVAAQHQHQQQHAAMQNGAARPGGRDVRKIGGPGGSKIFMSQLPPDVQESDIEELFRETVGPVFEVVVVCNSQGRSKGMAVVHFQRLGDAAEARKLFNGKFIDGSRPLKIELITDPPEITKSLAERLGASVAPSGTRVMQPNTGISQGKKFIPRQQWRNRRKGPRQVKKSAEQLDREMEAYRAAAPRFTDTLSTP